ncbi:MAG: hypothetical protein NVSMB1_03260 [Polyangiales bacterium]
MVPVVVSGVLVPLVVPLPEPIEPEPVDPAPVPVVPVGPPPMPPFSDPVDGVIPVAGAVDSAPLEAPVEAGDDAPGLEAEVPPQAAKESAKVNAAADESTRIEQFFMGNPFIESWSSKYPSVDCCS